MKSLFIIPFLFLSLSAISQKPKNAPDQRFAGLDVTFTQILKDWHAAGFAVAVVEKNKIIYAKGFGYRDVEKKLPVTPNTLFAIGSCTKAFTASLIGLLQKEGKVDLDKPAISFLPELKFYNDNLNNSVTPRDMLSHRTGLPRHDLSWYLFSTDSMDSLVHRIRYMEPSAPLREKWQYNNFMYLTLGVMDEKLTGNTWEKDVKEKLLDPLQMVNSNFTIKDLIANPDASLGYGLKKDSIIRKLDYYNIAAMSPAGAINSSVNEMANWVITWINDGKFNGKQIIPSEFRQEAISSQSIIGSALPGKEKPGLYFSNYGFGWMLSSYNGHYRAEHGGNIDGFSASTSFFPSDSLGIIVLSNQDGSVVPSIVRNMIADRMLGLKFYDWNADMLKSKAKDKPGKDSTNKETIRKPDMPLTHLLKDYQGNYYEPGYGTLMITLNNDSLFAMSGKKIFWMRHNNYDVFDLFEKDNAEGIDTTNGQNGIQFQFQLSSGGDIESLSIPLESSVKPIIFKKQLVAKDVSKESLQKYIGEYDLKGVTVKFYLKNDKTLYAFVPGQPEYELVPVDKDKFAIKVLSGYFIQFDVDQNKKVTGTTFVQPNGNFKAVKK
ncbi:MAG TPA: serine hydrolase [Hanamia sp.]|nr:serine hydrolase [Hanamia sp.]